MSKKWKNIFLLIGLASIVWMLLTFDMDWTEIWTNVKKAGWCFLWVVGIWVVIYFLNTLSWMQIIRGGRKEPTPVNLFYVYKLSISGFALNYATPFGLMGGEPYRIMELSPYIGTVRATSSVILYVMMHIFSHICFWFVSVLLYIVLYPLGWGMGIFLFFIAAFCLTAIYFFMQGYKHGLVIKTLTGLCHMPWIGKWAQRFLTEKKPSLERIDAQIAELHAERRSTFWKSFGFEFIARFMTSLEVYFILKTQIPDTNFFDSVLIMAFTSLFSNALFFSPMQLGAREGGFALAVSGLSLSSGLGVYVGLLTRLRELIWIAIGVGLMKIGSKKKVTDEGGGTSA